MRLIVLTENTTSDPRLTAEHGLSLYIESGDIWLLFDTGQSDDALLHNAQILGVDLSAVDIAILSHGHYDHGGGLSAFFSVNRKAEVYLQGCALGAYYNAADQFIGLPDELHQSKRLHIVGDMHQLNERMTLFSCNDVPLPVPIEPFGLQKRMNNALSPDDFLHEQYLLITEGEKRFLISGCSHKGAYNLAAHFQPDVFIGGLHLSKLEPQNPQHAFRLDDIAAQLLETPAVFYTCHCTGEPQYEYLRRTMRDRLRYLHTGDMLQID